MRITKIEYDIPRELLVKIDFPHTEEVKCVWCYENFKSTKPYHYHYKPNYNVDSEEYEVCDKCVEKVTILKQFYEFRLNFISSTFTPCEHCQNEIDELINANTDDVFMFFDNSHSNNVSLRRYLKEPNIIMYGLILNFVTKYNSSLIFTPCFECQKTLHEMLTTSMWNIDGKSTPITFYKKIRIYN